MNRMRKNFLMIGVLFIFFIVMTAIDFSNLVPYVLPLLIVISLFYSIKVVKKNKASGLVLFLFTFIFMYVAWQTYFN